MFPVVVSADHSTAGNVDCHFGAGSDCAKGTDHDSTDWVVPRTSARSLVEDWYANKYYF